MGSQIENIRKAVNVHSWIKIKSKFMQWCQKKDTPGNMRIALEVEDNTNI